MKYSISNPPLICMLTESACYKGTNKKFMPKGILWHSTGANNPNLSRYVQPTDFDKKKAELSKLLGPNKYGNDFNHSEKSRQMGVNAWVGKLADGTVTTIQTMPWTYKPWGCGSGIKGSCNETHLQFEICEDDLKNKDYALAVYNEACELTAYWCQLYNLDPHGTIDYKGIKVPVILDHATSHDLGLGNNHGDIQHWFPKLIGKTLENIRDDVAKLLSNDNSKYSITTREAILGRGSTGLEVKELQLKLLKLNYSLPKYGADGDFGNETLAALKQFQQDNNIITTGIYDTTTQETMMAALANIESLSYFYIQITGGAVNVRNKPSTIIGKVQYTICDLNPLKAIDIDEATGWYHLEDGNYISNKWTKRID